MRLRFQIKAPEPIRPAPVEKTFTEHRCPLPRPTVGAALHQLNVSGSSRVIKSSCAMAQYWDEAGRRQALTGIQAQKLPHAAPRCPCQMLFLLPQSLEEAPVSLKRGPRPLKRLQRHERELAWG